MNVRNLFKDNDAVSPVIGVILMVAITVILAAVIGAFVLNIGGSQEATPTTNIQWESHEHSTQTYVSATVQSGDPVKTSVIEVKTNQDDLDLDSSDALSGTDELSAGDTMYIYYKDATTTKVKSDDPADGPVALSEDIDTVEMVWHSPSSDKSSIIASFTA